MITNLTPGVRMNAAKPPGRPEFPSAGAGSGPASRSTSFSEWVMIFPCGVSRIAVRHAKAAGGLRLSHCGNSPGRGRISGK